MGLFSPSTTFFTAIMLHILFFEFLGWLTLRTFGTGWAPYLIAGFFLTVAQVIILLPDELKHCTATASLAAMSTCVFQCNLAVDCGIYIVHSSSMFTSRVCGKLQVSLICPLLLVFTKHSHSLQNNSLCTNSTMCYV
jgi:hypothetical protein